MMLQRPSRVDVGALVATLPASELRPEMLHESMRWQAAAEHDGRDFGEVSAVPADHANEGSDSQVRHAGDIERDHARRLRHLEIVPNLFI
jgi:hypothetical protein